MYVEGQIRILYILLFSYHICTCRIVADCTRLVSARFIPRPFESDQVLHTRKYLKLWVANESLDISNLLLKPEGAL